LQFFNEGDHFGNIILYVWLIGIRS